MIHTTAQGRPELGGRVPHGDVVGRQIAGMIKNAGHNELALMNSERVDGLPTSANSFDKGVSGSRPAFNR